LDKIGTDKWGQCLRMCPLLPLYCLFGMSLDENRVSLELSPSMDAKGDFAPTEDSKAVNFRMAHHGTKLLALHRE